MSFDTKPMIKEVTLSEYSVAAQVHAVAQVAYALEAKLIGCAEFPPLSESLEKLQRSRDRFLICQRDASIVAALSFEQGKDSVSITRLVVHPSVLRQGIAKALLMELERLFPLTRLIVSTAQANLPAVSLYHRLGYTTCSVTSSAEGIALIQLHKRWTSAYRSSSAVT